MIPFSGNPLDRASEKRTDAAWVEAKARDPGTLILPMWKLQPFLLGPETAQPPPELGHLGVRQDQEPVLSQARPHLLGHHLRLDRGTLQDHVARPAGRSQHAGPHALRAEAVHLEAAAPVGGGQPFGCGR